MHLNIEQGVRNTSVPFFMYNPRPSRTSSCGSRLIFYFEVEFLHLCLSIKEKKKITCKNLKFTQESKRKQCC